MIDLGQRETNTEHFIEYRELGKLFIYKQEHVNAARFFWGTTRVQEFERCNSELFKKKKKEDDLAEKIALCKTFNQSKNELVENRRNNHWEREEAARMGTSWTTILPSLLIVILVTSTTPTLSQDITSAGEVLAECDPELLGFELVTGYVFTAPDDLLDSMPGTLMLTDCLEACHANESCHSVNYETGLCVLFASNADNYPGHGVLYLQAEILSRNDPVPEEALDRMDYLNISSTFQYFYPVVNLFLSCTYDNYQ
uniref:Apple domain-containing protein n=1 Tax=Rhodnius prolixus TaxID=13249 RepID=T1HVY5_RHOPR